MKTTLPTLQLPRSNQIKFGLVALSLAVLASGFGLAAPLIMAQTANDANQIAITAIPPRLGDDGKIVIKPGERIQVSVKVRNASDQPIRIDSSAVDFILSEDGETPVPVTDQTSNRWSLTDWVVLSPSSQVLSPNELGIVNVVVTAPKDALPGGHYAMILHRPSLDLNKPAGDQPALNSATGINQRVGSLLYVVVEGPVNEEAFVTQFTFPKLTEYGPVPFSFNVENMSDIHISPRTSIDIYNLLNQKVASLTVEPKNVFPLMKRQFSGEWQRRLGSGRYKATLTMSFGQSGKVVLANTTFWLLPYKLIAIGTGITLVVLLVLGWAYRQSRHRRQTIHRHMAELEQKVKELEKQA